MLETSCLPIEARSLGNVEIRNLHAPTGCGVLFGHKTSQRTFSYATLLGDNTKKEGHRDVSRSLLRNVSTIFPKSILKRKRESKRWRKWEDVIARNRAFVFR